MRSISNVIICWYVFVIHSDVFVLTAAKRANRTDCVKNSDRWIMHLLNTKWIQINGRNWEWRARVPTENSANSRVVLGFLFIANSVYEIGCVLPHASFVWLFLADILFVVSFLAKWHSVHINKYMPSYTYSIVWGFMLRNARQRYVCSSRTRQFSLEFIY